MKSVERQHNQHRLDGVCVCGQQHALIISWAFLSITQIKWIRKHHSKEERSSSRMGVYMFILSSYMLYFMYLFLSFAQQQVAYWSSTHTCTDKPDDMNEKWTRHLRYFHVALLFGFLTSLEEFRLRFFYLICWSDKRQSLRSVAVNILSIFTSEKQFKMLCTQVLIVKIPPNEFAFELLCNSQVP